MSYDSKSIFEIVEDIEKEKAFLPAIQRKFVWPRWKIEGLFDSLMRNYPIGSFLFWELSKDKAHEYVFYNFLKKYDERKPFNERKIGSFMHPEIIGVLDGQQRLSSMYLGIQGSHRERLRYHRSTSDHAYPETFLYLNLLSLPYKVNKDGALEIDKEKDFEFRFLSLNDSKHISRNEDGRTNYCYWFRVGDVLKWSTDPEIDEIYNSVLENCIDETQKNVFNERKRYIKKAFRILHNRICEQKLINYFKVTDDDLDDILKIFIRVNSGGTILSKTDLLFSTIVATWEDGRDEIEAFLNEINEKGDGYRFNNDFLMRSCLVLSDLPVLFKVNSFKSKNVQLIRNNWNAIKAALSKTVDLLVSFGFNGSLLTSQMAIIVIAYHFMKGGDGSEISKQAIRKYLLHSLLKNVYGGQGDQMITSLRNSLRKQNKDKTYSLKQAQFPFDDILQLKLPANKTMKINSEDVEEFLLYRKGANTFLVLSLLYPNLRFNEVHFHQDHIHPDSSFTNAKLESEGVPEEKWTSWQQLKDTVPNLQLMEGRQNESKNATPFKEWIIRIDGNGKKNVPDLDKFCADNYIPTGISYDITDFEGFYNKRKDKIVEELEAVLNLPKTDSSKIPNEQKN